MAKQLIMVHGRDFKPKEVFLKRNWIDAIKSGIVRDFGEEYGTKFDGINKHMAYYGNLSNKFLYTKGKKHDEAKDNIDRRKALKALKAYQRKDFLKATGKKNYQQLPGQNPWYEALADTAGEVIEFLRLGKPLVSAVAPDMAEYWNDETTFSSCVRWKLTKLLAKALRKDDDVLLIAHSLGSLVAYDVLWKLSHYCEYQDIRDKKLSSFISIGSPLGDETSKRHLKGAHIKGKRRYPHNMGRWINLAAEDDYVSHDEKIADDYKEMEDFGLLSKPIKDRRIYNLAVRGGKSNPHHGAGYLIHPEMSKIVANWIDQS